MDQRFSMSQLNEGWASRTQDERDEMAEKDKEQRIKNLSLKYGRTSVRNVRASAEREEKKTGKRISFLELKKRIEDAKEENRDKKKGIPFYDSKGRGRIIDGKKVYYRET